MIPLLLTVRFKRCVPVLLLLAFVALRLCVLIHYRSDLDTDPDAYLAIARQLQQGHGFSVSDEHRPTAFRPPLYPLLLTFVSQPEQRLGRGVLQLSLALLTFFLLLHVAGNLGLAAWQTWLAALWMTCDPLSLRYIAFPMTETLCACLTTLLMLTLTARCRHTSRSFVRGLVFGLCVLSRPTFWAFGILWCSAILWRFVVGRMFPAGTINGVGERVQIDWRRGLVRACLAGAGVAVCVLPWVVRNWGVLGTPIVMTTHGGYTLLLGNNPAFYREVVAQPWGTIWDGTHGGGQAEWMQHVQQLAAAEGIRGEVATDRWMSRRAWSTIRQQPALFAKACLIKFTWFWNLAPHGPEAERLPFWLLWGIRVFYVFFWYFSLIGLWRVVWGLRQDFDWFWPWLAPILIVVALTTVHLMYWSDARMRAPITPALALLAAAGAAPFRVRSEESAGRECSQS